MIPASSELHTPVNASASCLPGLCPAKTLSIAVPLGTLVNFDLAATRLQVAAEAFIGHWCRTVGSLMVCSECLRGSLGGNPIDHASDCHMGALIGALGAFKEAGRGPWSPKPERVIVYERDLVADFQAYVVTMTHEQAAARRAAAEVTA